MNRGAGELPRPLGVWRRLSQPQRAGKILRTGGYIRSGGGSGALCAWDTSLHTAPFGNRAGFPKPSSPRLLQLHPERIRRNQISRFEPLNRSADWQPAVSRLGNPQSPEGSGAGRLPVGDTAGCQPALRAVHGQGESSAAPGVKSGAQEIFQRGKSVPLSPRERGSDFQRTRSSGFSNQARGTGLNPMWG